MLDTVARCLCRTCGCACGVCVCVCVCMRVRVCLHSSVISVTLLCTLSLIDSRSAQGLVKYSLRNEAVCPPPLHSPPPSLTDWGHVTSRHRRMLPRDRQPWSRDGGSRSRDGGSHCVT